MSCLYCLELTFYFCTSFKNKMFSNIYYTFIYSIRLPCNKTIYKNTLKRAENMHQSHIFPPTLYSAAVSHFAIL